MRFGLFIYCLSLAVLIALSLVIFNDLESPIGLSQTQDIIQMVEEEPTLSSTVREYNADGVITQLEFIYIRNQFYSLQEARVKEELERKINPRRRPC